MVRSNASPSTGHAESISLVVRPSFLEACFDTSSLERLVNEKEDALEQLQSALERPLPDLDRVPTALYVLGQY